MLELALLAVLTAASGSAGAIEGTVVSEGTGEALVDVHVAISSRGVAITDEYGAYAVRHLPAGTYTLLFSRFGYYERTIEVVVPDGPVVRLDVRLAPRPIAMPAISVFAARTARPAARLAGEDPLPPGSRHVALDPAAPGPLSHEADALRAFEAAPGVDIAEEAATGFHVRGGSADQNQILVNGLPVYNAYHSSGVLTGVNPDAVASVTIHAGATPARYGGGLSSTVDIVTRRPSRDAAATRGGIGPGDARATLEAPLPGGGELLLAGRRTTYDVVQRGSFDRGASSDFDEALATLALPSPAGRFEALALHARNGVSFFADPGLLETDPSGEPPAGGRYNSVRWSTDTNGLSWVSSGGGALTLRASAWRAATGTAAEWTTEGQRIRFDHRLEHLGAAADVAASAPWGRLRAGAAAERVSSSFRTRPLANPQEVLWQVAPRAAWGSGFVEHRWIPHDRWLVDNGIRMVAGAGQGLVLEPRLSLHFRPREEAALAVGYARVHQFAQSLRNEESALHAAFGFDPLVATGDGVPAARSDQFTASAQVRLAPGLDLELDAYLRHLAGLVLVAPETGQPFAVDDFAGGSGRARGVGAALFYRGAATDVDLVAEWGTAKRSTPDLNYEPTFSRKAILAAASRRLGASWSVRSALRLSSGRATSELAGGFAWEPFDQYTGEVEFAGTPLPADGILNGETLPAYARLDAGVRRVWRPAFLGEKARLVTWLDVLNLLNRKNVMALVEEPAGSGNRTEILYGGTSVSFGLLWSL